MPHFFEYYVKGKARYTDLLGFKTLLKRILLEVKRVMRMHEEECAGIEE